MQYFVGWGKGSTFSSVIAWIFGSSRDDAVSQCVFFRSFMWGRKKKKRGKKRKLKRKLRRRLLYYFVPPLSDKAICL